MRLNRTRKINSKYNDNENLNNILKENSYDKKYRNKYLWLVGHEIQNGKCNICNKKLEDGNMIVDHIVQKQYFKIFGEKINDISNFQVLCSSCNSIKTYDVDNIINKMFKNKDKKTEIFEELHIFTMKLLQDTFEKKKKSIEELKRENSSDDESESDIEDNNKQLSNLLKNIENYDDDIEYEVIGESESESEKEEETTRITRSKSGSLPKPKPNIIPNIHISKSKDVNKSKDISKSKDINNFNFNSNSNSNNIKRKISNIVEDEIEEINHISKKMKSDENSVISIPKKKEHKIISLLFKNCTFNFSNSKMEL